MARYFTSFTASNPLSTKSGSSGTVTMVTSPAPPYGTHALRLTGSSASYGGYWPTIPAHTLDNSAATDAEYIWAFRQSSLNYTVEHSFSIIGLYSFEAYVSPDDSTARLMFAFGDSGWLPLGITIATNTWYWARVRKRGNTIGLVVWAHGNPEPQADTHTVTITTNSVTMGSSQDLFWTLGTSSSYQNFLGYISVGLGEPAYRPWRKLDGYVRDSGVWKPADPLYVRDAGVWKDPVNWYAHDAGVWKDFYG